MKLHHQKGKHSSLVRDFFELENLDAFYSEEVLNVIYGPCWESILITDDNEAFFHIFSRREIRGSNKYDIEPFLGYAGPLVNTQNHDFINRSTNLYSEFCRENNIVAELIRFNPVAQNHKCFKECDFIKTVPAKQIVITDCFEDEAEQLKNFSSTSARYRVNKGKKNCLFREVDKSGELNSFINLYTNSLITNDADSQWFFPADFFRRIQKTECFRIFGVFYENKLVSTALAVLSKPSAYYLLAANSPAKVPGANEMLIVRINQIAASNEIPYFILGGGNSASPDDSLLRFKKKFTQRTYTFYIGKMIHDEETYNQMCDEALRQDCSLRGKKYHLKYRLLATA